MRFGLLAVAFFAAGGSAHAETITPNHLDCSFNETTQSLTCPEIPMPSGRASAEPPAVVQPAAERGSAKPEKGSAEWNARCAAKYKSFDPATGLYKSYKGIMRPCV